MGVTSYASYLGPQVFTFPLVRSDAAVSIPAELKDYVFDAEYYSSRYADLAQLYGTDEKELYYHFVNYGIEEGRSASPFFDVKFYANQNGHRYVDTFNSKWLTGCLDLGHTVLVGSQPEDMIRAMGSKRIQALHVHDVLYTDDTHTMPYLGKINWDNVTQALADIDYQGDFTFEADYFFVRMPAHLQPGAVKMLHDTGRSLIADIQAKKK
jgi:hypothetical protein